ncbi:MAG TPA: cupredoxin domain-containing protein [Rhodanobacter sp.]|nr:cupredoxin domain-containing protein [Rhodanobacter sp.]
MRRMMVPIIGGLLAVIGVSTPIAAATAKPQATVHAHRVHVIVIDKMQYGPMPAGLHAGDSIEWVNRDIFEHSVTARDGRFDIDLKPGASMRTTAVAGTTAFFCKFHPGMTGTLVVK